MSRSQIVLDNTAGAQTNAANRAPGHWVLAQAGKRVLRPGGVELTDTLLAHLDIGTKDTVIELAPGLGGTARKVLARKPLTYLGVDREAVVVDDLQRQLGSEGVRFVEGCAEDTGLPGETATVLFGEAMLTMQPPAKRKQIVEEAWRILRRCGRYGMHELCVCDGVSPAYRRKMQAELAAAIQHGVHLLTADEWREVVESAGFTVSFKQTSPMRLLSPVRVIQDEGFAGAMRFGFNALTDPAIRPRVLGMRRVFNRYRENLQAIALISNKVY